MSVDPFIVDPGNSQSINPYSYVLNNPLGFIDPSGYNAEETEEVHSFDASTVDTITINENGAVETTFNNGADAQYFDASSVSKIGDSGGTVDIGSQISTSKSSSGSKESQLTVKGSTTKIMPRVVRVRTNKIVLLLIRL